MKEFQSVVQDLLHNHERHRRYVALLTVLCMIMSFTVSLILIEPAESWSSQLACGMEEHNHTEACYALVCGQEASDVHEHTAECVGEPICGLTQHTHSEGCYISLLADVEDTFDHHMHAENMTDFTANLPWLPDDGGEHNAVSGELSFSFTFNAQQKIWEAITSGDPKNYYILVELGDNIKVTDMNQSGEVKDSTYSSITSHYGQPSGHYKFEEIDGKTYARIDFTEEYIKYVLEERGGDFISGTLNFNAEVRDDRAGDGYIRTKVGEKEFTLGRDYSLNVEKSREYDIVQGDNGEQHLLNYTVMAYSDEGVGESGTTITVTDSLTGEHADNYVTMNVPDSIKVERVYYKIENGRTVYEEKTEVLSRDQFKIEETEDGFVITDLPTLEGMMDDGFRTGYRITYNATIDKQAADKDKVGILTGVKNEVVVQSNSDSKVTGKDDSSGNIHLNLGVDKKGEIVESNGVKKIKWTVTINNPTGTSLDGVELTDVLNAVRDNSDIPAGIDFTNAGLTVSGKLEGGGSFSGLSNNYLSFDIQAGKITLTDNTDSDGLNSSISSITLTYYTEIPDDAKYSDSDTTYTNTAHLKKGDYSAENSASVTYNPNYSIEKSAEVDNATGKIIWKIKINNPDGWDLDGFEIEDEITLKTDTSNNHTASHPDAGNVTLVSSSVKSPATVTWDQANGTFKINGTVTDKTVTIIYSTVIPEAHLYSNDLTEINKATLKKDNEPFDEKTIEQKYEADLEIEKTGEADYFDGKIIWTVVVKNPDGVDLNKLQVRDGQTSATAVKVEYADSNLKWHELNGWHYTVIQQATEEQEERGVVRFPEGLTYTLIRITYETKITNPDSVLNEEFENTAFLEIRDNTEDDNTIDEDKASVTWKPGYYVTKSDADMVYSEAYNGLVYHWQIDLGSKTNSKYSPSLENYTITDEMFASAVGGLTVIGTIRNSDGTLTTRNLLKDQDYTIDGNTIKITNHDVVHVTITYDTPVDANRDGKVDDSEKSVVNGVTAGKNNEDLYDTGIGEYDAGFSVEKYVNDGYLSSDGKDWVFEWTIIIHNPNRIDLNGMTVTDDIFSRIETQTQDFTVTAGSRTLTNGEGSGYTVNGNGLTFNTSITETEVRITYKTTVNTTLDDSNTEKNVYSDVRYADTNKVTFDGIEAEDEATYEAQFSFSKAVAEYDPVNEIITWRIVITNSKGLSLNGAKVTDNFLSRAEANSLSIMGNSTGDLTGRYTQNNNTITFGDIRDTVVTIEYKTAVATDMLTQSEDGKSYFVRNSAELKIGDITRTGSDEQPYSKRDELSKTRVEEGAGRDGMIYKIPWQIDIGRKKGDFVDQVYTDKVSLTSEGEHYITKAQAEAIQVTYKLDDNGNYGDLDSARYEFTWLDAAGNVISELQDDTKIYGFRITFKGTADDFKDVSDVRIKYLSTVDVTTVEAGHTVKFENTVENGKEPKKAEYEYTKPNDVYKKYDANQWELYRSWNFSPADNSDNKTNPNGIDFSQKQSYLDSELETVTGADGKVYYLLKWHVRVAGDVYDPNKDIVLTDTLPAPLKLYEGTKFGSGYGVYDWSNDTPGEAPAKYVDVGFSFQNSPRSANFPIVEGLVKANEDISRVGGRNVYSFYTYHYQDYGNWNPEAYTVTEKDDGQQITFRIPSSMHGGKEFYIDYTAMIAKEDLEALFADEEKIDKVLFSNEISGDYGSDSQEIEVEESVIGKRGESSDDNSIKYAVELNEKAEDLDPNSDTLTLVDTIYSDDSYVNGEGKVVNWHDHGGFSATLKDLTIYEVLEDGSKEKMEGGYTVSFTKDSLAADSDSPYAAVLEITVPDNKHIYIEYVYHFAKTRADSFYQSGIAIFNNVHIQTDLLTQDASERETYYLKDDSGATSTTGSGLQIIKRDKDTYAGLPNAEFNLYIYDKNRGGWMTLISFDTANQTSVYYNPADQKYYKYNGGDDKSWSDDEKANNGWSEISGSNSNPAILMTSGESGIADLPSLPSGYILKAVEVKVPDGYIQNSVPTYFYYGPESEKGKYGDFPTDEGITNLSANNTYPPLQHIIAGERVLILNEKAKKIDVSAQKRWKDEKDHSGDTVEFTLYRYHGTPTAMKGYITDTDKGYNNLYPWTYDANTGIFTIELSKTNYQFGFSLRDVPGLDSCVDLDQALSTMRQQDITALNLNTGQLQINQNEYNWDRGFKDDGSIYFRPEDNSATYRITLDLSPYMIKTEYDADGVPVGAQIVKNDMPGYEHVTNPQPVGSPWNATWTELPSNDADGFWYYYVKETKYTVDGKEYTVPPKNGVNNPYIPVYEGNGLTSGGTVYVTNTLPLDITVKKAWADKNGSVLTNDEDIASKPVVKFKLYRYTTDASQVEAVEIDGSSEFELSSENNWEKIFQNLEPKDGNGKLYTYYVVETGKPKGYNVTYSVEGSEEAQLKESGTITITNKEIRGKVEADKQWQDVEGNLTNQAPKNAKVKFTLYQTTQPPAGRYTASQIFKYGSNTVVLPDGADVVLPNKKITEITVKSNTGLFNPNVSKDVTITIGSHTETFDITSVNDKKTDLNITMPSSGLTFKSNSATAITEIVLRFEDGETLIIRNAEPSNVTKPAGVPVTVIITDNKNTSLTGSFVLPLDSALQLEVRTFQNWLRGNENPQPGEFKVNGSDDPNGDTHVSRPSDPWHNCEAPPVGWEIDSEQYTPHVVNFTADEVKELGESIVLEFYFGNAWNKDAYVLWFDGGFISLENYISTQLTDYELYLNILSAYNAQQVLPMAMYEPVEGVIEIDENTALTNPVKIGSITLDGSKDNEGEFAAWKALWDDLPIYDDEGNLYYYYIKEDYDNKKIIGYESNGVTAVDGDIMTAITVTNDTGEISTEKNISVTKVWIDGENESGTRPTEISVTLYQSTKDDLDVNAEDFLSNVNMYGTATLNESNEWSFTWEDLPLYVNTDDTTSQKYYYYVKETVPSEYTVTYTNNGTNQNMTITNTKIGDVEVDKSWNDGDGTGRPTSIEYQLYRTLASTGGQKPNSLKILALGDSITNGDGNGYQGYTGYLRTELENVYGFTVNTENGAPWKCGYSRHSIDWSPGHTEKLTDKLDEAFNGRTPDAVLLLAGTNDIIDQYGLDKIDERLEGLITQIYGKAPGAVIFLASIPDFNFTNNTSAYSWFSTYYTEYHAMDAEQFESYINGTIIKNYNTKIEALVNKLAAEGKKICFVDINRVVLQEHLDDGCHPNGNGNEAMAKKWAEAINSYYLRGAQHITTAAPNGAVPYGDPITVTSKNDWKAYFRNLPLYDAEGNEYVYYVTEKSMSSYADSYENNGVLAGKPEGGSTITVINTPKTPTTKLKVTKNWLDNDNSDQARPESITLRLERRTMEIGSNQEWRDVTELYSYTLRKSGNVWTFDYGELPAKDSGGNLYFYRVVETDVNGYETVYDFGETADEKSGVSAEHAEIALTVINIRTTSLDVEKQWADETSTLDSVQVKLYRTTDPTFNPNIEIEIPWEITMNPENGKIAVDGELTITSDNKDIANVEIISSTPDEDGKDVVEISWTEGSKTITATGKNPGKAKIKVTSTDGRTETFEVEVVEKTEEWLKKDGDNWLGIINDVKQGQEITITIKCTQDTNLSYSFGGAFQYWSNNLQKYVSDHSWEEYPEDDYTITVHFKANEDISELKFLAYYQNQWIQSGSYTISGNGSNSGEPETTTTQPQEETTTTTTTTIPTNPNPPSGDSVMVKSGTKWSIPIDSNQIVESIVIQVDDSPFASQYQHIKIGISYGDEKTELQAVLCKEWDNVDRIKDYDGKSTVDNNGNVIADFTFDSTSHILTITNPNHMKYFDLIANSDQIDFTINYTINYATTSKTSLTVAVPTAIQTYATNASAESSKWTDSTKYAGAEEYRELFTIEASEGYLCHINDLPMCDKNNRPYYYWVEEVNVPGYKATYMFMDGDPDQNNKIKATNRGSGKIVVYNTRTDSVTMPSTGGTGTRGYTAAGITIMVTAGAFLILKRRKSANERDGPR